MAMEELEHGGSSRIVATKSDDDALVLALRNGDEGAFTTLIERYHASMVRLATLYVPNSAVAEEVVQETWVGVLRGIDRFAGRSSFKTWLFRILTNQAKRRGQREARSVSFSALSRAGVYDAQPVVDPDRFLPPGDPWAGHWAGQLQDWRQLPDEVLLAHETRTHVQRALDALPSTQRLVLTMRDIEGWTAAEVCNALTISETNQRVLLHRARSKVRRALECYLEGTEP
jgi:RNA polymerase sigma-70 factor (ECF subfamily)